MSAAKIYARTIVAKCLASAKTEQTALSRKIQYLTEMTNYLRN